jgi:predicted lipid carrier protein YhbT
MPLFLIQPLLQQCIATISEARPEVFRRLGSSADKTYVVDADNLPFVFVLSPRLKNPELRACRRWNVPPSDARISGSFLTLLGMIDGQLDGDALFFSRELRIEGDIQSVVVLRNALDDLEGSLAEDLARPFGKLGIASLARLRTVRRRSIERSKNYEA